MAKTTKTEELATEILASLSACRRWLRRCNGQRLYVGHCPDEGGWNRYSENSDDDFTYELVVGHHDSRAIRKFLAERKGLSEYGADAAFSMAFQRAIQHLIRTGRIKMVAPGSKIIRRSDGDDTATMAQGVPGVR